MHNDQAQYIGIQSYNSKYQQPKICGYEFQVHIFYYFMSTYYHHALNACGLKTNNNPHITKGQRHVTLSHQSYVGFLQNILPQ